MYKTGLGAIGESIKNSEKRSQQSSSGKIDYFNWQPGERKILRFLTDNTLTADFYQWILDKNGSTKSFLIDPSDPNRLLRYRSPVPGIGWRKNFVGGAPEEPRPVEMTVGIAVLREEVPSPDGKGMVIQDVREEKVIDGVTYPSRVFGVVHQNTGYFWKTLGISVYNRYGTICDRDYEITREGTGFDISYSVIPLPQVPELDTVEKVQQSYFYGQPWNREDPDRFLKCPITVPQWAESFGSEERYQLWLTPDSDTNGLGEFRRDTTSNPDEAQAVPPSSTRFSSLRETLLSGTDQKK